MKETDKCNCGGSLIRKEKMFAAFDGASFPGLHCIQCNLLYEVDGEDVFTYVKKKRNKEIVDKKDYINEARKNLLDAVALIGGGLKCARPIKMKIDETIQILDIVLEDM